MAGNVSHESCADDQERCTYEMRMVISLAMCVIFCCFLDNTDATLMEPQRLATMHWCVFGYSTRMATVVALDGFDWAGILLGQRITFLVFMAESYEFRPYKNKNHPMVVRGETQ